MEGLAKSIQVLAGQLTKGSSDFRCTMREFPVIMEEVVKFKVQGMRA